MFAHQVIDDIKSTLDLGIYSKSWKYKDMLNSAMKAIINSQKFDIGEVGDGSQIKSTTVGFSDKKTDKIWIFDDLRFIHAPYIKCWLDCAIKMHDVSGKRKWGVYLEEYNNWIVDEDEGALAFLLFDFEPSFSIKWHMEPIF